MLSGDRNVCFLFGSHYPEKEKSYDGSSAESMALVALPVVPALGKLSQEDHHEF